MKCPLCLSDELTPFHTKYEKKRGAVSYTKCNQCYLVFLDPIYRLEPTDEKSKYDCHENSPNNSGYVEFLQKIITPLLKRLQPKSEGLDFGSGPGPTLAKLFEKDGHGVKNYDPFYSPQEELLKQKYDFVTCTEVVEHFFNPSREFQLLNSLLKPGSYLGIMTSILYDESTFPDWWYHRDKTHVCFYQPKTFEWISRSLDLKIDHTDENIVLFVK
jgi:hypothetical protein